MGEGNLYKRGQYCCLCIPLRLSVFLNGAVTLWMGATVILFGGQESKRIFTGGYVTNSFVLINLIETTGALFGIIGMIGCWQNKASYLKIFFQYQVARVLAWMYMIHLDLPVLQACELWIVDINKAMASQGFNTTMYKIAFSGQCITERMMFMIFSTGTLLLWAYLTYMNHLAYLALDEEVKFLLRIPKDLPGGTHYSRSLAEKESLLAYQPGPTGGNVVGPPTMNSNV